MKAEHVDNTHCIWRYRWYTVIMSTEARSRNNAIHIQSRLETGNSNGVHIEHKQHKVSVVIHRHMPTFCTVQ